MVAEALVQQLGERGLTLAVAESLTGGALSDALVRVPGVSAIYRGGVTAYVPAVKASVLGVSSALLESVGTVDPQVAQQMAAGVAQLMDASAAIGTTGVAGPGPTEGKPAGTVFISALAEERTLTRGFRFEGSRQQVRDQTVRAALGLLSELLAATDAGNDAYGALDSLQ